MCSPREGRSGGCMAGERHNGNGAAQPEGEDDAGPSEAQLRDVREAIDRGYEAAQKKITAAYAAARQEPGTYPPAIELNDFIYRDPEIYGRTLGPAGEADGDSEPEDDDNGSGQQ